MDHNNGVHRGHMWMVMITRGTGVVAVAVIRNFQLPG